MKYKAKPKACSEILTQAAEKLLKNAQALEELKCLPGPGICIWAHMLKSARHLLSRVPGKTEGNSGSCKTEEWIAVNVSAPIRGTAANEQMDKWCYVQVTLNRAPERIYYQVPSLQWMYSTWQKGKNSPYWEPGIESWQTLLGKASKSWAASQEQPTLVSQTAHPIFSYINLLIITSELSCVITVCPRGWLCWWKDLLHARCSGFTLSCSSLSGSAESAAHTMVTS